MGGENGEYTHNYPIIAFSVKPSMLLLMIARIKRVVTGEYLYSRCVQIQLSVKTEEDYLSGVAYVVTHTHTHRLRHAHMKLSPVIR